MPFNARLLRKKILTMAYSGATVHIGCAFSIVEILAVLYRNHLRFDVRDPDSPHRDYMVLSKGHGVMAQYACLEEAGVLSSKETSDYFKDGTGLKGLADAHVPGVEVSSGSLGHGLSVGVGMALSAKIRCTSQICYALVGDGELNEGAIWEAALFAAHFRLDNLVLIVDRNGFQAMGSTDEVMTLGHIAAKLQAFGFDTLEVDGHNEAELDNAYRVCSSNKNGRPKAIVAKTVKGKGISFMENQNCWHYTRLSGEQFECALGELETNT